MPILDKASATQLLQESADALLLALKKSGQKAGRDWLTSIHQYPPEPALMEVMTLHVYKAGWFNEDGQGIHFETFLGEKEWKQKQIQIAMHIFHCEIIPGTELKRRAVAVPFVDEIFPIVSAWDGYRFRTGKYGAHPFTKILSFKDGNLPQKLSAELVQLCAQLGPVMDNTLKRVLTD